MLQNFSIVLIIFFLSNLGIAAQEKFGPFLIRVPSGWDFNEQLSENNTLLFQNSGENLVVKLGPIPTECSGNDDFSKAIMNIIQQLPATNEFVEQTKPSATCEVLGQKTTHLLVVKSRNSESRRLILSPVSGKRIYRIEISGPILGYQIPSEALRFLKSIGLIDGSVIVSTEKIISPKTPKEINPANAIVTGENIEFISPSEKLPEEVKLSAQKKPFDLTILQGFTDPDKYEQLRKEVKLVGVYELNPDGYVFSTPAQFKINLRETDFPAGYTSDNLGFVLFSNGDIENVPYSKNGNTFTVEIPHCCYLLAAVVTIPILTAVGSLALYMKGSTEPMNRRDCAKWIDTNNGKIKEIANDPKKFNINSKGDIFADIGVKMKGLNVGQGNHFIKPGNFMNKPEGDCVNFSSLYGSLLASKGYTVRMVSGNATYPKYSGGHQWIEVVIDGKVYYVDTYTPSKTKLVPLDVAQKLYKLKPGKMCYPDTPKDYDPNWYNGKTYDNNPDLSLYYELRAEHRVLQEFCAAGDENSCKQGTEIYRQAMEIRKKLETKGVKVVE